MTENRIPEPWSRLLDKAIAFEDAHQVQCYIVGGSVRQLLSGRQIEELDLVVEGEGSALQLAEELIKDNEGASRPSEINTLPTIEVRLPDVRIHISEAVEDKTYDIGSIYAPISDAFKADALRRDFTVNTLLLPISKPWPDAVIDPLGIGRADLQRAILRTPLTPETTLRNDPLRMLRAVRFCVTEGFALSDEVDEAFDRMAPLIEQVPGERISIELSRILTSDHAVEGMSMMVQHGLLHYIFPDIEHLAGVKLPQEYRGGNALNHSLTVMQNVPGSLHLRLAALFHDVGKADTAREHDGKTIYPGHQHSGAERTRRALTRLRFPNSLVKKVVRLVEMHMIAYREEWSDVAVRRLIHEAGDMLDDLLLLYRSDILARAQPYNSLDGFEHLMTRIKSLDLEDIVGARSPLSGSEIMETLGLTEGPEVGEVRDAIEQAIIDGKIPSTREAALEYLNSDTVKRIRMDS